MSLEQHIWNINTFINNYFRASFEKPNTLILK